MYNARESDGDFHDETPEVAQAFNDLIKALIASKGLDQKTKQLIYIAMKAALGDDAAIQHTYRWPNRQVQQRRKWSMRS